MCSGRSDENQALGLPTGSVRAILSLIVVTPIILSSCVLMFLMFVQNRITESLGILTALSNVASIIIGYYFGSNSSERSTKQIVAAHNKLLESHDTLQRNLIQAKDDEIMLAKNSMPINNHLENLNL